MDDITTSLVDHGDGTGTLTTIVGDADPVVVTVTDLPIPEPITPTPDPTVVVVAEVIEREVSSRLDASASTNAKIRAAIKDGLAAAVESLRAGQ